ncbi:MAG TPA: hypothetical protein IAB51_11250 [Candidatus Merdivicinus excrementipullorum]|uniref:Uncharacterized protein n=1 Tax=Candidatus Merdivicinus excrementipullorum TaxID=2840867 RepID=A0A9D1K126_9FIRM|nr:hypothetical protein [Candidatus Merdivicinus excrementipullorum]HIZ54819.1 hypothetical protein [Bacillota bacterium]
MELKYNELLQNLRERKFTFTITGIDGTKYENLSIDIPSYHDTAILFHNCKRPDGSTLRGVFSITPSNLIKAELKDNAAGIIVETTQGIYDIKFSL